jgi:uncharacterized protein (TIGR03435 family)
MKEMRRTVALTLIVGCLWAQAGKQFSAVSIRPNQSGNPGSETETSAGRVSLINVTPLSLLLRAFGVRPPQIVGAPGWTANERYDVMAVTEGAEALGDRERQPYFESMLTERWGLRFHREQRQLNVYALQVGRAGHKLRIHEGPGGYSMKVRANEGRQILESTKGNIPRLMEILGGAMGQIVVNDTSLNGEYDFTLEWIQDLAAGAAGPSLSTALREQLGLTLEPTKRSMDVIVIDSMSRPSEN